MLLLPGDRVYLGWTSSERGEVLRVHNGQAKIKETSKRYPDYWMRLDDLWWDDVICGGTT